MAIKKKVYPYYRFDKLLSYNGTYNFVVGGRGLGKTYGAKRRAITRFIERGEQFIYLRRFKSELHARHTFFDDLIANEEFANYDFRINGFMAQMASGSTRGEKRRSWQTIGYFIALSNSQAQKSVSFPLVTSILFDEFIIEKGALHELPDEATIFNNFYSTVDRNQDKTKVFFLANSVSIMNAYFLEYGIRPDEGQEFVVAHDNFIVCHFPDAKAFQTAVYQSKFGKFIAGTEYAKYAIGNEFSDNNDSLIKSKGSKARYQFSLETKKGVFSVWHEMFTGDYFVQSKLPKAQNLFTLEADKMSEEKLLMLYTDPPIATLRTAFRTGKVSFDEPSTRNAFIEIFKRR